MTKNKCEDCAAFHKTLGVTECHRNAPVPALVMQGPSAAVVGMFPAVKPDNWCMQWSMRMDFNLVPKEFSGAPKVQ